MRYRLIGAEQVCHSQRSKLDLGLLHDILLEP